MCPYGSGIGAQTYIVAFGTSTFHPSAFSPAQHSRRP